MNGDNRTIMLLDAGGTNFVFSAMKAGKEIVEPISKPSNGHDLDLCFGSLTSGFQEVMDKIEEKPAAISFAFPGPADYSSGIIGDLANFKAFSGAVPLGPMLENHFKMPVFINNDGDLFTYGEALAGILPDINAELKQNGNPKQYKNLVGITLGTGFGGGMVIDGNLIVGDNSNAGEVWITSNRNLDGANSEEGVSTRAIQNNYFDIANIKPDTSLMPKDIFDIAKGRVQGNQIAARESFKLFGEALGDTLANLLTIFDGLVVIGGGLAGARELYMPAVLSEIRNHDFVQKSGNRQKRLVQEIYDYDDPKDKKKFLENKSIEIEIPGSNEKMNFSTVSKLAIAHSKVGASKAIALGAYTYALGRI